MRVALGFDGGLRGQSGGLGPQHRRLRRAAPQGDHGGVQMLFACRVLLFGKQLAVSRGGLVILLLVDLHCVFLCVNIGAYLIYSCMIQLYGCSSPRSAAGDLNKADMG